MHGTFWVLNGQSANCAWNGTSWTVVPDLWRTAFLPEGVFGLHRRDDPNGSGMHDTQGYVAKFMDNAWEEIFAIDVKEIDPAATDMFLELRVDTENDIWVQINVIKGSGMPGSRHFGHWDGTTFTYDPAQAPPENCCHTPVPYDPEPTEPPEELRPTPPAGYYLTAFTQIPGTGQYWAVGAGQEDVPNAKTDLLILKSR
ncbi:hypothetical protein [Actinocorallia aurantiaca]|uniref:Uncharacterized protein n=1 Tax=Actinocorallia aurantiaca TaxID=46204 RepID=A0ABN3UJU4_9ACTN